jgi:hypothetical protein
LTAGSVFCAMSDRIFSYREKTNRNDGGLHIISTLMLYDGRDIYIYATGADIVLCTLGLIYIRF